MQIADVADRLYAADPDDFMSLRTEQVAAAKAAGDKALAKEIGQLRKPTRSAWLVNLLARHAADDLEELLEVGAALREAQQNLDVTELRTLSTARSKAVNALSRTAVDLGAAAGYSATDAIRQEVSVTLQAALADEDQGDLVRRGVLSSALSYGGFGPFELTAPGAAAIPAPEKPRAEKAESSKGPPEEAEDAKAAAEREAARVAWEQARDELVTAESDAERATAEADALADRVDDLRRQLTDVEQAEDEARRAARQARKHVDELTATERTARRDLDALTP